MSIVTVGLVVTPDEYAIAGLRLNSADSSGVVSQ